MESHDEMLCDADSMRVEVNGRNLILTFRCPTAEEALLSLSALRRKLEHPGSVAFTLKFDGVVEK